MNISEQLLWKSKKYYAIDKLRQMNICKNNAENNTMSINKGYVCNP